MKNNKQFEVTGIYPYNAENGGRFVDYRSIEFGMNLQAFYPGQNKRKLVKRLRREGKLVPHYVYRAN